MGRKWTLEDETFLQDNWGQLSLNTICTHLKRSEHAIKVRANVLGLGAFYESGDYITLNQLVLAFGMGKSSSGYVVQSWIKARHLPIHYKRFGESRVRVVYLEEFWKWAKTNRSFVNFSKLDPLILGKEPDWVDKQRRIDQKSFAIQRKDHWTAHEDERLRFYLKQHKYNWSELSELLNRSCGAIQRRCRDLGIKERPLNTKGSNGALKWSDDMYSVLCDGIKNGYSYQMIAKAIGKSEKAIRGKVYSIYFTENLDKVRAYIGEGQWGDNTPIPTVKQAFYLSRTNAETKHLIERLCGILYHRTLELKRSSDYDRYFQRAQCKNWSKLDSVCTAGGEDCDSCEMYMMIKPQYCVRCGSTFYELATNKYCVSCRHARKKQAQRKFAILGGRRN